MALGFRRIVPYLRAIGVGLLVSCATPTLPLPPPLEPSAGALTNGQVHLVGGPGSVSGNALVVVVNYDTSIPGDERVGGAVADNTGAWDAWVYAKSGDVLDVTQQVGTETSPPVEVFIQ